MTTTAADILRRALSLEGEERAALVAKLIESLDGPPDADAGSAWEAEIARRVDDLDSKRVKTIPWEEVRKSLTDTTDDAR